MNDEPVQEPWQAVQPGGWFQIRRWAIGLPMNSVERAYQRPVFGRVQLRS